jgi:hypothetical protein
MKFQPNSTAIVNTDYPCGAELLKGTVVTIIRTKINGAIVVETFQGAQWTVEERDLDDYNDLPKGNQLSFEDTFKKECDCGGFKTYDSMEPLYHASWCGSLK